MGGITGRVSILDFWSISKRLFVSSLLIFSFRYGFHFGGRDFGPFSFRRDLVIGRVSIFFCLSFVTLSSSFSNVSFSFYLFRPFCFISSHFVLFCFILSPFVPFVLLISLLFISFRFLLLSFHFLLLHLRSPFFLFPLPIFIFVYLLFIRTFYLNRFR